MARLMQASPDAGREWEMSVVANADELVSLARRLGERERTDARASVTMERLASDRDGS